MLILPRFVAIASVFLALLALSPRSAEAQAGAVCTISDTVARVVSDNPYTVELTDQCKLLVFTDAAPIAVSLPNAAVLFPLGFRVAMRANGAGAVTITADTSLINGAGAPFVLASGTAMDVWTDGVNYFTQAGAGAVFFGTVDIDQTIPGTTNGVQVNAALPAGTNVIGHVIVDTAPTTAVTGTFWQATQPVSGTVTANAGTNLNTSSLALEAGGNLATLATGLGSPGATTCATDTGSCSLNALTQRNNQRLTTLNTTLGSPFQAGGSIGNTSFGVSGTLPAFAAVPAFKIDQTIPGTTNAVQANAGTNLNTSLLALESGGNLAQVVTDLGAPGATACATDTGSCNFNQLFQRHNQRLTTLNTTLGTPMQATGGTVGLVAGSATIGALTANQSVNLSQIGGVTTQTGNGTASGAMRVTLPTDGTGVVGLSAGSAIVGKVGIDQTTPGGTNAVAPIAGQNGVAAGAGAVGATVQRVTLASNDPLVASSAAISGAAAITPHDVTTVAAGRQWLANCTVAGDVKVKFSDTSVLTIPMAIGLSTVPWAIIQVFITGTTATCSYYNLL